MRFGITPLQFDNTLGIVGVSGSPDFTRFDYAAIIREIYAQGFSLIELTLDVRYVLPGGLSEQAVEALRMVKEELDLTFTAHLPLWAIEPATPNQFIREASVACTVDAIELVKPLNPEVYVLHNTGALAAEFNRLELPNPFARMVTEYFKMHSKQSVEEILDQTGIPSEKLALENVEFPFEATWQIAEALNTGVCLDTGHLLAGFSGDIGILEFIDRYFSRIREVHLHDGGQMASEGGTVRRYDHQALGTGMLPIEGFLSALLERNYDGTIIFELSLQDALESLKVIRDRLTDFPIDSTH
ncbi:MAG: cobamide remodeling phosphodiesterase CbiR [Candidatus Hodarchaeota archaeon]